MIFRQQILGIFEKEGIPLYRAKQVFRAIYKEGQDDYSKIAVLPAKIRELLNKNAPIFSFKQIEKQVISKSNNAVKALFRLADDKFIEGVLMRFKDGRNSVCVSSQIGCGLKCAFCATGQLGLKRNLSAAEITDQVLYFDHWLKKHASPNSRVTHVVFMGMGEPLLNYDEVMKAARILNDPEYLGIASRHITVSTSGIIPGIEKLAKEKLQVNLAVSLHAPVQDLREKLMPIAKTYKIPALIKALQHYTDVTHRRVTYEYIMLRDVNDSPDMARNLASLLRDQLCHVNLIAYNETGLGFVSSQKRQISKFAEILESFKIPITIRVSLGQDIKAACGQLATDCTLCTRC